MDFKNQDAGFFDKQNGVRNDNIDLLKGIAAFFVVWGHLAVFFGCTVDDLFSRFITSFNMPMFALLGGYCFHKPSKAGLLLYIKRKTERLIVPGIFWTITIGLVLYVFGDHKWYTINLWYIWSIFIVYIILGITNAFIPEKYVGLSTSLVILIIWLIPSDFYYVGYLMPFFCIGSLLKEKCKKYTQVLNMNKKTFFLGSFVIYIVLLSFFTVDFFVYYGGVSLTLSKCIIHQFFINCYRIIITIPFFVFVYYIMQQKKVQRSGTITSFFITTGRNSLIIYIFHVILLIPIKKVLPIIFEKMGIVFEGTIRVLGELIIAPLFTTVVILFCFFLKCVIAKVPILRSIALS